MTAKIGILGYGRIGSSLVERATESDDVTVGYVYTRPGSEPADADVPVVTDRSELAGRDVDLAVEAATHEAVADLGPTLLETTDIAVLSLTALADADLTAELDGVCESNDTRLYVPHGAVLGLDGLQDAREMLDEVSIETRKNPDHLDYAFTDEWDAGDVDEETVLHDGAARGVCDLFPRNVNVHAAVALAGIGFDETRSRLVADPDATTATHTIAATGGDGTTLEVRRSSPVKGVTSAYTLPSIWGTVRRILSDRPGRTVV